MKHFIFAKFNILDSVIFFCQKKDKKGLKYCALIKIGKYGFFLVNTSIFYDKVKKTTDSDNGMIVLLQFQQKIKYIGERVDNLKSIALKEVSHRQKFNGP